MSGALNALAGNTSAAPFTVTVADAGAGVFGFESGSYGAISPSSFLGNTITVARSGAANFGLTFSNDVSTTPFRYVVVQDTSGAHRTYQLSDAGVAGGIVGWGAGADKAWTAAGTRTFTIHY